MIIRIAALTISLLAGGSGAALAQPPAAALEAQASTTPRPASPGRAVPAKAPAAEQTTPEARTPQAPPREPRREGQPVNIRVEVTITDQRGGAAALKKTVTVVTGDGMSGFIRSQAEYMNIGTVPLNIDTEPIILADGKIRLRVNLQYDLPAASDPSGTAGPAGALRKTEIRENLALILESGKALIAAQSADPVGDRQVTVEVKATILR